jgi:hypothetical protein
MRIAVLGAAALLGATLLAPQAHAASSWVPVPEPGGLVIKRDGTVLRAPAATKPTASGDVSPAASLPVNYWLWMQDDNGLWEYFWIGSADGTLSIPGSVFHKWENTDGSMSGPVSLNGWFTSGMDGIINIDGGRLEIFGRAGGGDLVHIWQKAANGSTGWSSWASLGGSLQERSGVYANTYADNTAFVQVIGVDGALHTKYRNPSGVWDSVWF